MDTYQHKHIEKKWQKNWAEKKVDTQSQSNQDKEKYFVLDMLPYPSGDGLHMGHTESYTASDIVYRYKRMRGYHVLHNQAFDSFGLPAENYAIKTGVHPSETTVTNGSNYIKQMKNLGLGYDYDDVFYTSSPEYYKWTQWFFSEFFKNDLIYRKTSTANWCPSCQTVLANEQVEQGQCERCKSEVVQKEIPTWSFRITNYAEELITGLDDIDWPEHTKKNQTNWIGKSEGANIKFPVKDSNEVIEVFTTRPDTLFGATYMVLAPEHTLLAVLQSQITNWSEVEQYVETTNKKTELERMENKEKTGVRLEGVTAINPASKEEIPVYIADYVLGGYGTGAIMAVPAHDERDAEFAEQFGLPKKQVVAPRVDPTGTSAPREDKEWIRDGRAIDAIIEHPTDNTFLLLTDSHTHFVGGGTDGEDWKTALLREVIEETGFSDITVVSNEAFYLHCNMFRVSKDKNLDTLQAFAHIKLNSLEQSKSEIDEGYHTVEWVPRADILNKIEWENHVAGWNGVMDSIVTTEYGTLVNSGEFDGMTSEEAGKAITEYVGGEMTTTYRLKDWSISRQRYWGCPIPIVYDPQGEAHLVPEEHLPWVLPTDVDFVPKGTAPLADSRELVERTERIFGEGWRPEVDTMDTFVCSSWYYLRYTDPKNTEAWADKAKAKYWLPVDLYIGGAEHTYMHLLYARFWVKAMKSMGMVDHDEPFTQLRHQGYVLDEHGKKMSKSKGNVVNPDEVVERFGADATRLYMMFAGPLEDEVMWNENGVVGMYRFIEKVWRQQDKLADSAEPYTLKPIINKTIKKVTSDVDQLKFNTAISAMMICVNEIDKAPSILADDYKNFVRLLSIFAPHVSQEILEKLGESEYVSSMSWPKYDETAVIDEIITLAVQVNGKMRGTVASAPDADESEVTLLAHADDGIEKWLSDGEIKKVVYVPGRILNFIVQ